MNKKFIAPACLLISLSVVFTFSPALNNGFTNWDDNKLLTENPHVRDFSLRGLKTIFASFNVGAYIPLTVASFGFEYKLAGLNPLVFHADNLLLHLMNCLLVFWLFYFLSRDVISAFTGAILWSLHPLRVESVAWVTERKDVLYSFFFLLSCLAYLYSLEGRKKLIVFSLLLFVLSLFSKPSAVVLPLVLFSLDYLQGRKFNTGVFLEKIPYFGLAFCYALIAVAAQKSSIPVPGESGMIQRLFLAGYSYGFYVWKILFPVKLSALYPYPEFILSNWLLVLFSFIILVAPFLSGSREIKFAFAFFLSALAPVLHLIPMHTPAVAADRYVYVPSVGLFYLAGIAITSLHNKRAGFTRLRLSLIILLACGAAAYSLLSMRRCAAWKDSVSLWSGVLEQFPHEAMANNSLGGAYSEKGEFDKAIGRYTEAVTVNPGYLEAYNNRGLAYAAVGQYGKAVADFDSVIRINPRFAGAYFSRGRASLAMKKYGEAEADFIESAALDPFNASTYFWLGTLAREEGKSQQALSYFTRALDLEPGNDVILNNRGVMYARTGDYARAENDFRKALAINPGNKGAESNLAKCLGITKDFTAKGAKY